METREFNPVLDSRVEEITPELAKEYLKLNSENRTLHKDIVNIYAEQMAAGNWSYTDQPITFFNNGKLGNGQHRLHAIIKSGCTIKFVVNRNVPATGNYDNNLKRSTRDQITLAGGKAYKHYVITTARLAVKTLNRKYFGSQIPRDKVEKWLSDNDCDIIEKIYNFGNRNSEVNARCAGFVLGAYSFYTEHPAKERLCEIKEFYYALTTGIMNKPELIVAIKLRNSLLNRYKDYPIEMAKLLQSNSGDKALYKIMLMQQALSLYHNKQTGGRKKIIELPDNLIYPIKEKPML